MNAFYYSDSVGLIHRRPRALPNASGPGPRRWPRHGPSPTTPRSLGDHRFTEPDAQPDRRAADQNHARLYRAERRDEGCRDEAAGIPPADAGVRIPVWARADARDAREDGHRPHRD